jgi:hypothetical protein
MKIGTYAENALQALRKLKEGDNKAQDEQSVKSFQ